MTPDLICVAFVSPAAAMRAGWRAFLSVDSAIKIVAESTSLNQIEQSGCRADVLVITSDSTSAAQLSGYLQTAAPTAVLLLVGDQSRAVRTFSGVLQGLVLGVLPVNLAAEEMLAAVHALDQGLVTGTPHLLRQLLGQPDALKHDQAGAEIDSLTQRETLVLQLLAQGLTNKQMALNLGISEHTVKFHIQSIYSKMRVNNRAEVVRVGVTCGLIIV